MAGGAGWSNVKSQNTSGTSNVQSVGLSLAYSSNVTAGNVLVAGLQVVGPVSSINPTISDTQTNAWTVMGSLFANTSTTVQQAAAFCIARTTATPTVTVTWNINSSLLQEIYLYEFVSPGGTVSQDGTALQANGTTGTTITSPAANGSGTNDCLISVAGSGAAVNGYAGGWTANLCSDGNGSGYLLNQPGNSTPDWTQSSAGLWISYIVALQPAAPAPFFPHGLPTGC